MSRNWGPLCEVSHPLPVSLIREFYLNLSLYFEDIGGHYLTSWIRGTKYKITKHVVSEALGVPLVHRPTLPNTESPPFDDVMSLLCGRLVSWGSKLRINSSELCSRKIICKRTES